MRRLTAYPKNFHGISYVSITFIVVFFLLGCKKENTNTIPSIPAPLSMHVISGNNQVGYPNKVLNDTIIVKVTPKNLSDIDSYSFYFGNYNGSASDFISVIDNEVFIKIVWTMGTSLSPQRLAIRLYGNCANLYSNSCKVLDSVVVNATMNDRPWVYAYNSGTAGAGEFWDMHFSDALHGIAVGDFNTGLAVTNDGGNSWNFVNSIRNDYYMLSFSGKDTGIAIVTNNYAYFTTDGGNTFVAGSWSPPLVGDRSSSDYFMFSRNLIYSVGVQGNISQSTNGGMGWNKYNGFSFINQMVSVTCPERFTCFACGAVAKIIKSGDGGFTWTEQPVLLNNFLRKIYFIDKNFGFAGGQYGALVRTTDGGDHWSIIPTGLHFDITEIRFFTNSLGFIVSNGGEIAKTTDGGLTWQIIVRDNYGVYSLNKAYVKDSTIAFGLQGHDIFKYNLR